MFTGKPDAAISRLDSGEDWAKFPGDCLPNRGLHFSPPFGSWPGFRVYFAGLVADGLAGETSLFYLDSVLPDFSQSGRLVGTTL